MANPQHVLRLWKGANQWNLWRQKNINELPDLEGVYITKVKPQVPEVEPGVPEYLKEFDLSRWRRLILVKL